MLCKAVGIWLHFLSKKRAPQKRELFFYLIYGLFHQHSFFVYNGLTCFQADEIHAAGHLSTIGAGAVPNIFIVSHILSSTVNAIYQLSAGVIDMDAHILFVFEAISDRGAGIEGVGIDALAGCLERFSEYDIGRNRVKVRRFSF